MRIAFIPPSETEFKSLFLSTPLRKGGGLDDINIYQPKYLPTNNRYRRGGGIFSFLAKRVLPVIFRAAKPSAKVFAKSVMADALSGKKPLKKAIKEHGIKALKDTGLRLITGSGKIGKKYRKNRKLKSLIKKKKKKTSTGYKRDIFDSL